MKFLFIDDSYLMREFLINVIKTNRNDAHDTFIEASCGTQALETLRHDHFDMVFVDWNISEFNGLELIEKVRELDKYKDTVIIMISSEQHKDLISQVLARGATDYIAKPVNALHFWEKTKKYMDE
jgi:two-component system chemotaxis response regulator CheY